MKTNLSIIKWLALAVLAIFNLQPATAFAQGTTAFTYQGQLHDGGTNANGAYTMIFKLCDAASGGNQVGSTITTSATLANGLFSVNLDFGAGAFTGNARWLDITVTNGGTVQTLSPRVQVLPSPYALFSSSAGVAANLAGGTWNTSVGNYQFYNGNTFSNAMLFQADGSVVFGISTNGAILANGGLINGKAEVTGDLKADGELEANSDMSVAGNATLNGNLSAGGSITGATITGGTIIAENQSAGVTFTTYGGIHILDNCDITIRGTGSGGLTMNGSLTATYMFAQAFTQTSDRNLKEKLTPIDGREVLERVASLPISEWNFKTDAATRHIGPMAQDFYAAFNVGPDDKHITTVDEGGVALAAIQGLNEKLKEKDARIEAMEKRLADLEQLVKTSAQK
jgi:hypothetical protein